MNKAAVFIGVLLVLNLVALNVGVYKLAREVHDCRYPSMFEVSSALEDIERELRDIKQAIENVRRY